MTNYDPNYGDNSASWNFDPNTGQVSLPWEHMNNILGPNDLTDQVRKAINDFQAVPHWPTFAENNSNGTGYDMSTKRGTMMNPEGLNVRFPGASYFPTRPRYRSSLFPPPEASTP